MSAFGFGGTNFHAVLSSHGTGPAEGALETWPAELFVVRAASDAELDPALDLLEAATRAEVPPRLCDLAATIERMNAESPARVAIVASSMEDLAAKLVVDIRRTSNGTVGNGFGRFLRCFASTQNGSPRSMECPR